ncbi:phosphotransferase enzyme family-domain-containing protein [Lasiosphaeria ovina]|uniref:Phosphotransferase enzyme family-domain-containing protein n=1 Tax=Lasiosphaeria ovina TaxID=92902 RepID=A0AAE0JRN3_9PEZI|nr:phosphotransferase enzyme family-domain-containing protein [Lasiosphaeria ovina]
MTRDATRDGLAWDNGGIDLEPCWTREPSLDAIQRVCRRHLGIPTPHSQEGEEGKGEGAEGDCAVHFHAAGALNKLYLVDTRRGRFMMRVSLPVDPRNKTRGEVATLALVRRNTDIPVPLVVAFDDTSTNEIGFEWILMDIVPGKPAYYRWRGMTMAQKEALAARVADFQAQLFRCSSLGVGFRGIGTLGTGPDKADNGQTGSHVPSVPSTPSPGPIVSSVFFSGPHFHYTVPRGPFPSSHDWLRAHLNIIAKEHTNALADTQHHDDREYTEGVLRVARKLLRMLPRLFPAVVHPPERTVLWNDFTLHNIMVDDAGRITAVLDWQCLATVPRWTALQVPDFLRGATRHDMPDRDRYTDVSDHGSNTSARSGLDDGLDNEGKTELFWIHLMEYEQTQLRKVYAARMRQRLPEWDMEIADGALKVDFLGAVSRCGAGFYLRRIEQWVDALERKDYLSLMEVLRVGIKKERSGGVRQGGTAGQPVSRPE